MFKFFFLLFLLLLLYLQDSRGDKRIIGGKNAPEGIAPYQVSLQVYYEEQYYHICGGSIIKKQWILTAAHCVDYFPNTTVLVGTNKLSTGGQRYDAESIILYDDYNKSYPKKHDIALIKLTTDIIYNDKVKAIDLASRVTEPGTECLLTGWGSIGYGKPPDNLQMLYTPIIDLEDCKKQIRRYGTVTETQICVYKEPRKGACVGDSGGPLVADNQLVGVVSWGVPCGAGYPDVFTNVYAFLDWINKKTS